MLWSNLWYLVCFDHCLNYFNFFRSTDFTALFIYIRKAGKKKLFGSIWYNVTCDLLFQCSTFNYDAHCPLVPSSVHTIFYPILTPTCTPSIALALKTPSTPCPLYTQAASTPTCTQDTTQDHVKMPLPWCTCARRPRRRVKLSSAGCSWTPCPGIDWVGVPTRALLKF